MKQYKNKQTNEIVSAVQWTDWTQMHPNLTEFKELLESSTGELKDCANRENFLRFYTFLLTEDLFDEYGVVKEEIEALLFAFPLNFVILNSGVISTMPSTKFFNLYEEIIE